MDEDASVVSTLDNIPFTKKRSRKEIERINERMEEEKMADVEMSQPEKRVMTKAKRT